LYTFKYKKFIEIGSVISEIKQVNEIWIHISFQRFVPFLLQIRG